MSNIFGYNSRTFSSRACACPSPTAPSIRISSATAVSKASSSSASPCPGSPAALASAPAPCVNRSAALSSSVRFASSVAAKPATSSACACPMKFAAFAPAPSPSAAPPASRNPPTWKTSTSSRLAPCASPSTSANAAIVFIVCAALTRASSASTTSCPAPRQAPTPIATWFPPASNAIRSKESVPPPIFSAGSTASAASPPPSSTPVSTPSTPSLPASSPLPSTTPTLLLAMPLLLVTRHPPLATAVLAAKAAHPVLLVGAQHCCALLEGPILLPTRHSPLAAGRPSALYCEPRRVGCNMLFGLLLVGRIRNRHDQDIRQRANHSPVVHPSRA